jgi:hypothetical protein
MNAHVRGEEASTDVFARWRGTRTGSMALLDAVRARGKSDVVAAWTRACRRYRRPSSKSTRVTPATPRPVGFDAFP